MLRGKTGAPLKFEAPEVLEERNRRIAELVGKKLRYGPEKIRDLNNMLSLLAKDTSSQKIQEYLYEKLWKVQSGIQREDIRKIITKCHEDAIGWLQNTYQNLHDN